MKLGKKMGKQSIIASIATLAAGLLVTAGSVSAANANDEAWVPQSSVTATPLLDQYTVLNGECYVLVQFNINEVAGESVGNLLIEGNPPNGDGEDRFAEGTYGFTYDVTNLNSTADPQEVVGKSGSFSIPSCDELMPDPSATLGPLTATANDDGTTRSVSFSGSVSLADIPEGASVTVVTTASSGGSTTTTGGGSYNGTITGTFPDGTVTITSQTFVDGSAVGSPVSTTVTFTPPVVDPEPTAPIVDGQLGGVLTEDNKSAVHAVVTVVRGDAEGPLTVVIGHGETDVPDQTLVFEGGAEETLRVTFEIDECGDIPFTVAFADSPVQGKTQVVDVPCPATSGGGNGDNSGGGDDGDNDGSTGGNTGGSDNTDTDTATSGTGGSTSGGDSEGSTNTNDGNDVPDGATDGFGLVAQSDNTPAILGGSLLSLLFLVAAVVAFQRRRALAGE